MQEFLKKLFIFSAALFGIVVLAYGVLYFTDFGRQGPETPEERQLNIDPALVAAYSSGIKLDSSGLEIDRSETIISLYNDGNASISLQSPEAEGGIVFGLWERTGSQVQFYYSSGGVAGLPTSDTTFEIQGENLIGSEGTVFVRLVEDNLVEDISTSEEGPQGIAVLAAMEYVINVLGGTDVEFVDMVPTRPDCSTCFTVTLSYLQAGVPTTIDVQVEGGVVL